MPDSLSHLTLDVTAERYAIVMVAVIIAGITDALWLKISNWLTFPLLGSGLLFHVFVPAPMGIFFGLSGAILGFGLLVLFFIAGGMGAGDVKLLAGIGAWIGPHDVLVVFIVSGLLVGLASVILMVWDREQGPKVVSQSGSPLKSQPDSSPAFAEPSRRIRRVPMGTMMALALLLLMLQEAFRA